jgi:hypothetical protein
MGNKTPDKFDQCFFLRFPAWLEMEEGVARRHEDGDHRHPACRPNNRPTALRK